MESQADLAGVLRHEAQSAASCEEAVDQADAVAGRTVVAQWNLVTLLSTPNSGTSAGKKTASAMREGNPYEGTARLPYWGNGTKSRKVLFSFDRPILINELPCVMDVGPARCPKQDRLDI